MKLLILSLLMFLISCENSSHRFKVGDCFAFEHDPAITGSILEISEDGYRALIKASDGYLLSKTNTKTSKDWISKRYLEDTVFKINCEN